MSKSRAIGILVSLVFLYPLSYLVASRDGEYKIQIHSILSLNPVQVHYGLDLDEVWQPFPTGTRPSTWFLEARSAFYLPLITLDRKLWHKTKDFEPEPLNIDEISPQPPQNPPMDFPIGPLPGHDTASTPKKILRFKVQHTSIPLRFA